LVSSTDLPAFGEQYRSACIWWAVQICMHLVSSTDLPAFGEQYRSASIYPLYKYSGLRL
jgi:hypothetical protein